MFAELTKRLCTYTASQINSALGLGICCCCCCQTHSTDWSKCQEKTCACVWFNWLWKSTSLSNSHLVIIGLCLVGTQTFYFYCIRQHIIIYTKYLHPYYRFKLYNCIYLFLRLLFILTVTTVRDDRVALLARPRTEDLLPGLVVPVAPSYACP